MSQESKKKSKKKKKHRLFWFMIKLQILLMAVVLGCFAYFYLGGYAEQVRDLQEAAVAKVAATDDSIFVPSQTSTIYDADGGILAELKGDKTSDYVNYQNIPINFIWAEISSEDKRFYRHNGVNLMGILRAVKAMIQNGQAVQGGSTITMQLAKLMYMESSKTWQYKVEQMFLALELEKRYTKNKIMEFYLNNIYFANNYYGIQAACHGYFDCELAELTLSQCAFLCAIPNSPTYYDPLVNFGHTIERRDRILKSMYDDGKITQNQYVEATNETITLHRPKKVSAEKHNYVDTYVYFCATRALMEKEGFEFRSHFDSEEEEKEYSEEYDQLYAECQKKIYTGGYKIYTSIKMDIQEELQKAVDDGLSDYEEKNDEGVYAMQGSAVCIDNDTGYVVAIVGGRDQDFGTYTLNRAYQSHRQPGSSIKPLIVYTPMFERGYTPDTPVTDEKFDGGPSNSNNSYIGETDVRTAVTRSINTVAWKLYEVLTPEVGLSYLKEMNFTKLAAEDVTPATSLGGFTIGVSAVEMASAYSALENDGEYRRPTCIETIIDSDENMIYVSEQNGKKVYGKDASRMMTDTMKSVLEREDGTGKKLKLSNAIAAGKTGTTNSHKDGWFVGYTRYYTTAVWVGYDIPREVKELSGSTYPGRIWNSFMEKIHKGLPKIEFLPYAKLSDDFGRDSQQEDQEDDAGEDHEDNETPANRNEDNSDRSEPDRAERSRNDDSSGRNEREDNRADDADNADQNQGQDADAGNQDLTDNKPDADNDSDNKSSDKKKEKKKEKKKDKNTDDNDTDADGNSKSNSDEVDVPDEEDDVEDDGGEDDDNGLDFEIEVID